MTSRDSHMVSYRSTILACYLGHFVQATVINLTPVLFIPLKEQFGLSFQQLGLLVLINFITQVTCDIAFSQAVDKYGFRPFVVAAPMLTVIGFILFALSPTLFYNPYTGFVMATIIFSGSSGLLELLLSPIVNAIPTDEKATAMSVLHSFYAWGQLTVVLVTTLLVYLFGRSSWPYIMVGWTILPLVNSLLFVRVPLAPQVGEEHRQGMKQLIGQPFFLVALSAILLGGAAEVTMNQWTSAFMEKAMAIPKVIGDTAGMCMFALMLGAGRLIYGMKGSKLDVGSVMMWGSLIAAMCYVLVAVSPVSSVSLVACALCGIAVSLLWPGTLVVASARYPLAGAWLFAILAAGGDIGASLGPWLMGVVTEHVPRMSLFTDMRTSWGLTTEQFGLRVGMLIGVIFPLGAAVCHVYLKRWGREMRSKS